MNKVLLIAGGSGGTYLCLALLMGVLPGVELSNTPAGPGVRPLTALQAQGRDVYVANGCSYCHTQYVRPLNQDKVFGRPSAPGDFAFQTPELLGSERTGPDLTNIGARQPSEVWHYIHLYNPRSVVPASIMPPFAWLFDVVDAAPAGAMPISVPRAYAPSRGVVVPTEEARALVAYLISLRQAPIPATAGTDDLGSSAPRPASRGLALFTANCAACHQASGEGLPGVFPPLKANGAVNRDDAAKHLRVVLSGLHGGTVDGVVYPSAMPPFAAQLNDADIADIVNYERGAWGNHGKTVTAAQVATERAATN